MPNAGTTCKGLVDLLHSRAQKTNNKLTLYLFGYDTKKSTFQLSLVQFFKGYKVKGQNVFLKAKL